MIQRHPSVDLHECVNYLNKYLSKRFQKPNLLCITLYVYHSIPARRYSVAEILDKKHEVASLRRQWADSWRLCWAQVSSKMGTQRNIFFPWWWSSWVTSWYYEWLLGPRRSRWCVPDWVRWRFLNGLSTSAVMPVPAQPDLRRTSKNWYFLMVQSCNNESLIIAYTNALAAFQWRTPLASFSLSYHQQDYDMLIYFEYFWIILTCFAYMATHVYTEISTQVLVRAKRCKMPLYGNGHPIVSSTLMVGI